jgi:hypothetical protein
MRAIFSEASSLSAKIVAHAPKSMPAINIKQKRLGLKTRRRCSTIGITWSRAGGRPAENLPLTDQRSP